MRDSEQGIDKMAVGHHIQDRSHVIKRSRDRAGNIEENQDYINLEEGQYNIVIVHFDKGSGNYIERNVVIFYCCHSA